MNIQHLRYFISIAHFENISKASEELLVSQPALSMVLRQLEEELGAQLFERQGKKLKLTRIGYQFLQSAESAIGIIDRSIQQVKNASWIEGSLRIYVHAGCSQFFDLLSAFTKEYPNVQISLLSQKNDLTKPISMPCELALVSDYETEDNAHRVLLAQREQIYAILPRTHPLAGCSSLSLRELKDEYFIFGLPNGTQLEHAFQRCIESGFQPKIRYMVESAANIKELLSTGTCVGLTYNTLKEFYEVEGLKTIPCEDIVHGRKDIYLSLLQKKPTPLALTFFRFAENYMLSQDPSL